METFIQCSCTVHIVKGPITDNMKVISNILPDGVTFAKLTRQMTARTSVDIVYITTFHVDTGAGSYSINEVYFKL